MSRILIAAVLFTWIVGLSPVFAEQQDWTGNINVFLGAKALDDDDWEPVEEQDELGISLDFRQKGWPFNIVLEYLNSSSDNESVVLCDPSGCLDVNAEGETSELNFGIRKIWDTFPTVRPFIGGGLSLIKGELSVAALGSRASDSDSGIGLWFGGGVYWTLAEHFNLGLEAKVSTADVTLFGVESDAGGGHFGLIAGYHW